MKLATQTNEITGNMQFSETVAMEIDPSASGIILDSLIKIYTNPYVAALREYTSNAYDSHKSAGQTRSIQVSLPTKLAPIFMVEDFGTGMTRDELRKYGQFGWSTKRESNDAIGGFGLGSKVGLAFSSQYTVQAIKDGKKNIAVIGRDEDGNPQMGLLDEEDTDKPNGVKVTIPTTEYYKFSEALRDHFFIGFDKGGIVVDGKPSSYSVSDTEQFELLADGLGWRRPKGVQHNIGGMALVGGVVYRIDWNEVAQDMNLDYQLRTGYLNEVVVNLENGAVDIARSRETLVYSKRTREVLKTKLTQMLEYARKMYAEEIEAAPSMREALVLRAKANSFGFGRDFTWRGKKINFGYIPKHNHNEDQFTITSISSGGNSELGLMANKELSTYGFVTQSYNDALYNKHTILVTGASQPKTLRNRLVHSESYGAAQYANYLENNTPGEPIPNSTTGATRKAFRAQDLTFFFTSGKASDYSQWFVGAFERVITAEEYMKVVDDLRREISKRAAERRKANTVVKSKTLVRKYRIQTQGGSSISEVEASNLDPKHTHVLLQAGASDFTDKLIQAVNYRKYYQENSDLVDMMYYLVGYAEVTFLYATKSMKTKDWGSFVPNLVRADDLIKLIETKARNLIKGKSEIEKRAIIDRANGVGSWTYRVDKNVIGNILNKDVHDYLSALKSQDQYGDSFLAKVRNNATALGLDASSAKVESSFDSPSASYPLLDHLSVGWGFDWNLLVEYINMADRVAGRIK